MSGDQTHSELEEIHAFITGKVQGVGFRYATRSEALSLGATGWVRNTEDGRVEVLAQGSADVIDAFTQWLADGPPASRVTAVEVRSRGPVTRVFPSFEVRG